MKRRKKRRAVTRPKKKPVKNTRKRKIGKPVAKTKRKKVKKPTIKTRKKITRKPLRKKRVVKRDKKGRFTSSKKKRLRKPIRKLKAPKLKTEFPEGVVEGERFITPGLKYEYRQFYLPDFDARTIAGVINTVQGEPQPWPIAFYIHLEYTDKDGGTGDVGTSFFRFKVENAEDAERACIELASQYEIDSITEIELLATYSVVKGK